MAKKKKAQHSSPKSAAKPKPEIEVILRNRKVRHDFEILEEYEAGLELIGSEVKSLRAGDVQWGDAHGRIDRRGQLWLHGLYIGEYRHAGVYGHLASRPRRLLLHKRELRQIAQLLQTKGLTIVPSQLHFRRGFAKIRMCVVRGRKRHDKREHLKAQATKRDIDRELARRQKYR